MRRLVVKSSTAVYGSSPRDPAMFTEDTEPQALPRAGFAKDSVEVEGYVRGFARRRPTSRRRCCGSPTSSARGIATPLTATSPCRSCRPCSASTRACSSCTRTTRSRPCAGATDGPPGHLQRRPATACCCSPRPSGGPAARRAGAVAAPSLRRPARPARRPRRLLARADAVPTYGRVVDTTQHARGRSASSPRYTTAEAFEDFVERAALTRPRSPRASCGREPSGSLDGLRRSRAAGGGPVVTRRPPGELGASPAPRTEAPGRRPLGRRCRADGAGADQGGTRPPSDAGSRTGPRRRRSATARRAARGRASLARAVWRFLRRRLTGDYEVDEFGFDAELTDHVLLAAAAPALPALVPGRGARHGEHAGRRAARSSSPTTPARSRWTR